MSYRRPVLDAAVAAMEKRLKPLLIPEPADAAGRRTAARENDIRVHEALAPTAPETATEDHVVPVAGGHPDVRIRVYWPDAERPAQDAGLPVLVYLYGGGFTLAGIDWPSWDRRFRRRAHDSSAILIAVDYSHAPEVRFPAQPEQCWSALAWAHQHAAELGGDPGRMAIGGASSGGNLAAVVTLMNRDRGAIPLRLQILENPAVDLTMGHAETKGIGRSVPGLILRTAGRLLVRQYLGPSHGARRDPLASPIRAADHTGLPPALIITCELDTRRGDGEAYARALSEAGVPVAAMRFIGQTHGSLGLEGFTAAADQAHAVVVGALRGLSDS